MSHHHDAKAGHHRKQKPSKLTKAVRCATRSCTDECARRDRPSAALRQLLSRCSPESCGGSALGCTHALAQAGFEDASKENFGVGCVRANVCLAVLPSVCALQSRPSRRSPSSGVSAAVPLLCSRSGAGQQGKGLVHEKNTGAQRSQEQAEFASVTNGR